MEPELVCMMCFSLEYDVYKVDGAGYGTTEGEQWTYCKKCDCWTSHPPSKVIVAVKA